MKYLKALFITSDDSFDDFCKKWNVSDTHVLSYYRAEDWEALRRKSIEDASEVAEMLVQEQVEDAFDLEVQITALMNLDLKCRVEHLFRHLRAHGHLFALDDSGEVIKDSFGNPVSLKIPNTPSELMGRKNNMEMLLSLNRLIESKNTINPQETDIKKLSGGYMKLLEKKNDETD